MQHNHLRCIHKQIINVIKPTPFRILILNLRQQKRPLVHRLVPDMLRHTLHLLRRHKRILDPRHPRSIRKQHIPLANQLIRTPRIQNRTRIHLRRNLIRNPSREIRLNRPRNHIHRRTLRRNHQMNSNRPRQLSKPRNRLLNLLPGRHHQIRKLINHHHNVR